MLAHVSDILKQPHSVRFQLAANKNGDHCPWLPYNAGSIEACAVALTYCIKEARGRGATHRRLPILRMAEVT